MFELIQIKTNRKKELKEIAKKSGTSVSNIVMNLIEEFVQGKMKNEK